MLLHEADTKSSAPRIEYKYHVNAWARVPLLNDLAKFCREDAHCAGRSHGYAVASVYYDNLAMKSYVDKLEGREDRFKLRVRFYPDDEAYEGLQIELKHKHSDRIMKSQIRISRALFGQVLSGNFDGVPYLDDVTLNHFYRLVKVNGFRPTCRIDYLRKAYFARTDEKVRITLDQDVRCGRFVRDLTQRPQMRITQPGLSILELKSPGHIPFWGARILEKYGLKRAAISKYAAAIGVLSQNAVAV